MSKTKSEGTTTPETPVKTGKTPAKPAPQPVLYDPKDANSTKAFLEAFQTNLESGYGAYVITDSLGMESNSIEYARAETLEAYKACLELIPDLQAAIRGLVRSVTILRLARSKPGSATEAPEDFPDETEEEQETAPEETGSKPVKTEQKPKTEREAKRILSDFEPEGEAN